MSLSLATAAVGVAVDSYSLLVQRAVQSCCFTSRQVRDVPTAQWLASFGGSPDGLERYHGLDGLRTPWRDYLSSMLAAPAEEVTVHSVLRRHRGVSPDNPYVQPTQMTYTQEVQPAFLARRVISTAQQIAVEWCDDLGLIAAENAAAWSRHWDSVKQLADAERLRLPTMLDCDATEGGMTPYRIGNYDLVKASLTRAAARRVVGELQALPSRASEADLLQRLSEGRWEGELPHHSADAFLCAVLAAPFAVRVDSGRAAPTLVDPLALAEQLMEARQALAAEWAAELHAAPAHFLQLQAEWLEQKRDDSVFGM